LQAELAQALDQAFVDAEKLLSL